MKNETIPRLRFKGFNDKWNIICIDDIAKYKNGKALEKYSNNKGSLIIVNLSSITDKGSLKDSRKRLIKSNTITTLNKNDLVMILSEQAPGLIGITAIIPQSNKFVLNQRVGLLRLKHPECSQCVHYLVNTKQKHFERVSGGTKQLNLSKKDILRTKLYLPSLPEQQLIGKFFAKLDKLIQLQQKKVSLLKKLKRGYLQKLFPRKGDLIPKVRFKGFHDKWNVNSLNNVALISRGVTGNSRLTSGKYRITRIETISTGKINTNKLGYTNKRPNSKYLLKYGDILFSNINSLNYIGNNAIFNINQIIYHGTNLLLIRAKNNINSYFLYYELNTIPHRRWAIRHANRAVSQASINSSTLKTQLIQFPTISEQYNISKFFKFLDKNINYQNNKLTRLCKLKKAYLQKMFC